ncbi:mitochondrial import inner membrane translocase subunit TIM16 [Malassezia psittaci]|uniref:Mitochondrial import inner membrane translocase subunit TIM16 n=1 Tax=Malassezia psittaci TaxID=1821823 RepID=A0AAF0JMK8_9BASI|nr:mitochondrial import inner membrane translocase subunit TIM16 [Malassezia psittaci]
MEGVAHVRAGQVEEAVSNTRGKAGAPSDALTRAHRMTLDEAKMILNLRQDVSAATAQKQGGIADTIRQELENNYERLFAINAPPAPKGKTGGGQGSFYMQSKVVRARERIEEEWKLLEQAAKATENEAAPPS